jgi:hypothetical protein
MSEELTSLIDYKYAFSGEMVFPCNCDKSFVLL